MTFTEPDRWATALITGASQGIGRELAQVFAAQGHDLGLTARGERRLAATADEIAAQYGVAVRTIAQDLSLPGAADALYQELGGARQRPMCLSTTPASACTAPSPASAWPHSTT